MAETRLVIFRIFILVLALWTGAGVFYFINGNVAWYSQPVAWVRAAHPQPGSINPWPIMTALVALATLLSLAVFAFSRGPGRREALIILSVTVVILIATGVYFVPRLILIFERTATLTDAQLIDLSRAWVRWNVLRIVVLIGLLYYGLVALGRMTRPTPAA